MNNIEILERLEQMQQTFREDGLQGYEMAIASAKKLINNLIQENKELKEKQKEYEKQLDLDYVEENYIPKSKIEKALDKMNERYMTPEAISNSNGATFNYWTGKIDMCIELLGENR